MRVCKTGKESVEERERKKKRCGHKTQAHQQQPTHIPCSENVDTANQPTNHFCVCMF